jgi:hypothetical protein
VAVQGLKSTTVVMAGEPCHILIMAFLSLILGRLPFDSFRRLGMFSCHISSLKPSTHDYVGLFNGAGGASRISAE